MLAVYGEGRGFRVVWLLEELGLAYRLRPVDLLAVENDRGFLAINPAVAPHDPAFAFYLQFFHLGEAGLAGR